MQIIDENSCQQTGIRGIRRLFESVFTGLRAEFLGLFPLSYCIYCGRYVDRM